MRYDAAIIGAGADGLAAAATLAGTGLKTIVLERNAQIGGRLSTREFHPGFRASPFADEIAPIPKEIFWSLDLARRGALLAPTPPSLGLWVDRSCAPAQEMALLCAEIARIRTAALARASIVESPAPRWKLFRRATHAPWPAQDWLHKSLADVLTGSMPLGDGPELFAAETLAGRSVDPFARGSAVHLLAPNGGSGICRGGLGTLGDALAASARAAGAEISVGLDVTDIRHAKNRVSSLALADGTEIEARAIISTLDLKRTFLALFSWKELPQALVKVVGGFRMAGSTARVLIALDQLPRLAGGGGTPRGAVHLAPSIAAMAEAHSAWCAGILAEHLPMMLRVGSALDPGLAPKGAAVMTVTIGCVPRTLFDGGWTNEKRGLLVKSVLAAIDANFPGFAGSVLTSELIVPADIEESLGLTSGDLCGGEIAPDQMFFYRPWHGRVWPRTPFEGLYLAGPSSAAGPLATCAAGVVAAQAAFADLHAGRLP